MTEMLVGYLIITVDMAVMDLGENIFQADQSYVALSRVTHLTGLASEAIDFSNIYADKKVLVENDRFRDLARKRIGT